MVMYMHVTCEERFTVAVRVRGPQKEVTGQ